MPKAAQTYNPYAPVETTKFFTDKGADSGLVGVVILDDEGKEVVVGQVSKDYHLVPNEEVDKYVRDLLIDMGLPYRDERLGKSPGYNGQTVFFNGGQFRRRYLIGDFDVSTDTVGHAIGIHLNVYNSYDGTKKYGYSLGLTVLACTNTMMVDYILGSETFKHIGIQESFGKNKLMLESNIDNAITLAKSRITPRLFEMTQKAVDVDFLQNLITSAKLPNDMVCGMIERAEGNTRWDLLNGATAHLGKRDSISADNVNRLVMKAMLSGEI
jgi:hypothetical protein